MTKRAALLMVTFVLLWAVIEIAAAVVLRNVTVWQVVWSRYTVHLILVLAFWRGRDAPAAWHTRHLNRQLLRSAMMLVMPGSFAIALTRGADSGAVIAMFWIAPLMVLGFAALFARERAGILAWLAAALGWVAGWLYSGPFASSPETVALSLAMASSFALYVVMTRGLRMEPLRVNMFYTAVVPWLALLPLMPREWVTPAPAELLVLAFIGCTGLIALIALDRAASAAPVSQTAPLLPLQIALTAILATLAGQNTSLTRVGAASVVVGGTLILTWHALARVSRQEAR